jgi:osmotically-inducible protein OsmY
MFKSSSRKQNFAQRSFMLALGLAATSAVFANQSEPIYNYVPADVLKQKVELALSEQQIDTSNLVMQFDEKGVVNASGNVESKSQADNITQIIKETESVYMVFGKFVYPQAE